MATKEFDSKFQEIFTKMVEISFELVGRNKGEIDSIFIYGSLEEGDAFFNVFYKVNGKLTKIHKLNSVSKMQYDVSDERVFAMLDLGNGYLMEVANLFKNDNREVPTLMKMVYNPKTGSFNNDISYDLHYSNDPERTNVDAYQEWFDEINQSV